MTAGTWPSIDHGLLSPSGHMSKAARRRADKRENERLFAGCDFGPPGVIIEEHISLRRAALRLRGLADRGMCVGKYRRKAEELEKAADVLEQAAGTDERPRRSKHGNQDSSTEH